MHPTDATLVQAPEWTYGEVPASADGSPASGGYERVIPGRFTAERDDRLMNSLIKNYAREIKVNGALTGQFFCNRDDAKAVFNEVIKTHKQFAAGSDFDGAFDHFDVNKDGLIEVDRMPQFLRFAMPAGALDIDLQ